MENELEILEKHPVSDIMSVLNDTRVVVGTHHKTYFLDKEKCEDIYTKLMDNDYPIRQGALIVVTDDNGDRIIALGDGEKSFKESIINQHSELEGDFLKLNEVTEVEGDASNLIEIHAGKDKVVLNKEFLGITKKVDGRLCTKKIFFGYKSYSNTEMYLPSNGGFICTSLNGVKVNGGGDIEFKPQHLLEIFKRFTDEEKAEFKTIMGL